MNKYNNMEKLKVKVKFSSPQEYELKNIGVKSNRKMFVEDEGGNLITQTQYEEFKDEEFDVLTPEHKKEYISNLLTKAIQNGGYSFSKGLRHHLINKGHNEMEAYPEVEVIEVSKS